MVHFIKKQLQLNIHPGDLKTGFYFLPATRSVFEMGEKSSSYLLFVTNGTINIGNIKTLMKKRWYLKPLYHSARKAHLIPKKLPW